MKWVIKAVVRVVDWEEDLTCDCLPKRVLVRVCDFPGISVFGRSAEPLSRFGGEVGKAGAVGGATAKEPRGNGDPATAPAPSSDSGGNPAVGSGAGQGKTGHPRVRGSADGLGYPEPGRGGGVAGAFV